MRIGIQIPRFTWPGGPAQIGPTLAHIGQTADEGGFASIWVMDHFFQIRGVGPYTEPMLEGYSALSFLAGVTKRARLGTMVSGVIYRYPAILVKTATTLDVLSGGRAYLGIGAAWNEQESVALGVPFPPLKERFELLEEALQIAHQMWSDNNGAYQGKHNTLGETLNSPQPVSQPHPPIMIGGMGEKKTMRLVAQYGDGCNMFGRVGSDKLHETLDALKGHCDRLGRDYNTIEKTTLNTVPAGPVNVGEIMTELRAQVAMGFQQAIFNFAEVEAITPLETFAREIIPAAAAL